MRGLSLLILATLLVPGLARADMPPDADKYMACKGLEVGAACKVVSFFDDVYYDGTCQELPCDSNPAETCLTCVEVGAETDPGGTAGPVTTGGEGTAGTAATTDAASSGGSGSSGAAGSTGDSSPADKGGCSCNSRDSAPIGGLALLLGAVLLRRRRR